MGRRRRLALWHELRFDWETVWELWDRILSKLLTEKMPRFLRDADYGRLIQSDNLAQIVGADPRVLLMVEQSAQFEMVSYLRQRYDVSEIFTDTRVFDAAVAYRGKDLVEYTEPEFDYHATYSPGDRVLWTDGKIYQKKSVSPDNNLQPDNSDEWEYVCEDRSLYYLTLPHDEWDQYKKYVAGDQVWYEGNNYTSLGDSVGHKPADDAHLWQDDGVYEVVGELPTNEDFWTMGDNRNPLIVQYLMDIALYHLHARINPRNIPELRMVRYDGMNATQNGGAIAWLKRIANGELNADLPTIVPSQGWSIEWGSERRNNNSY